MGLGSVEAEFCNLKMQRIFHFLRSLGPCCRAGLAICGVMLQEGGRVDIHMISDVMLSHMCGNQIELLMLQLIAYQAHNNNVK